METVSFSIEDIERGRGPARTPKSEHDDYMTTHHHNKLAYSRIENWLADVEDHSFKTKFFQLTESQATAIDKFRQETKLRMALRDEDRRRAGEEVDDTNCSLHHPGVLQQLYEFQLDQWRIEPEDSIIQSWYKDLMLLERQIDEVIKSEFSDQGAFLKLSVRSPKDSALDMVEFYNMLRDSIQGSTLEAGTPEAITEDLRALTRAGLEVMRLRDGALALKLLLCSDRIHNDLAAAMLYRGDDPFCIQIALREWCEELNPEWEFRMFVNDGKPTAMTLYSQFTYDQRMLENKDLIEKMCLDCWGEVKDNIAKHTSVYAIDFAVWPTLDCVKVIEINNMGAPLTGTGLFDFHNPQDKDLILNGPFSFRVREAARSSFEDTTETERGLQITSVPFAVRNYMEQLRAGADPSIVPTEVPDSLWMMPLAGYPVSWYEPVIKNVVAYSRQALTWLGMA